MPDLTTYRLGLAASLSALVVLAFSVGGVPDPLDPGPVATEFDRANALAATRDLLAAAPERAPGSEGDGVAATLVEERFAENRIGEVAVQEFTAEAAGEDRDLQNVLLTLPGSADGAILVLAPRDQRDGAGAASSAAATGVLIELAAQLGLADRDHPIVLASTSGGIAGARAAVDEAGGPEAVRAAIVIAQPGAPNLIEPHLLTGASRAKSTSIELVRTGTELLSERGSLAAGTPGAFGQLARLAIPATAFEHGGLIADGVGAIALSASGEAPLAEPGDEIDAVAAESMGKIGATAIALVVALDVTEAPVVHGPPAYVRVGDNLVPGWAVAVLALALLAPPGAAAVSRLALARRREASGGSELGWALGWALAPLSGLLGLYALALTGIIPTPEAPFDPSGFRLGPTEVLALACFAALAIGLWWGLGVRAVPGSERRPVVAAATTLVSVLACLLVWAANPFLALLLAPLMHLIVLAWLAPARRRVAAVPLAVILALPFLAALLAVANALDWGLRTPWQLTLLASGNGFAVLAVAGVLAMAGATAGAVWAAVAPEPRSRSRGGEPPDPA